MEINILKTEIPYQPYHTVCNEIQISSSTSKQCFTNTEIVINIYRHTY